MVHLREKEVIDGYEQSIASLTLKYGFSRSGNLRTPISTRVCWWYSVFCTKLL